MNFNPSVSNNGLIKSTILNNIYIQQREKYDSHLVSTSMQSLMNLRRNLNLSRCQLISYLMNISDTLSHSAN